jgi:ketosteroid isomerase-like protein
MKFQVTPLCLAVVLFGASAGHAQGSAEQQVKKAMDENFASIIHKDAEALNRQYTDDYFRTGDTGKVRGKAETIKDFTDPDLKIIKLERSDVNIRVYGDVAVVTELVTSVGEFKGKTGPEHSARQTVVWVKRNGAWQKAVLQITSTTPIPASAYGQ